MRKILKPVVFMEHEPTKLGSITNQLGQLVEFYEHPTLGDEAPVYAKIGDVVINTGLYETDDFHSDSEYNPVLTEHGETMCFFEYQEFTEKRGDTDYKHEEVTC